MLLNNTQLIFLHIHIMMDWPLICAELVGVEVDGRNERGVVFGDYSRLDILELVSDGVVGVGGVGEGLVVVGVDEVLPGVGDGLARVHLVHVIISLIQIFTAL
jgi:hypothetical protein